MNTVSIHTEQLLRRSTDTTGKLNLLYVVFLTVLHNILRSLKTPSEIFLKDDNRVHV